MKFQHLPIGARFEFEGKCYTKTGPLVAAEAGGGQRIIPRYATLRALSEETSVPAAHAAADVQLLWVLAAFDEYEHAVAQLLQETCGAEEPRRATLQTGLTAAGQQFRNKIKQ